MEWPISTGQAVALLGAPEHRITAQIRLGKVNPRQIVGRRAWSPDDILTVAKILGKDTIALRKICSETAIVNPSNQ